MVFFSRFPSVLDLFVAQEICRRICKVFTLRCSNAGCVMESRRHDHFATAAGQLRTAARNRRVAPQMVMPVAVHSAVMCPARQIGSGNAQQRQFDAADRPLFPSAKGNFSELGSPVTSETAARKYNNALRDEQRLTSARFV
jgi:hypothetical protein